MFLPMIVNPLAVNNNYVNNDVTKICCDAIVDFTKSDEFKKLVAIINKRLMEDHDFELEIKSILKIKHNVKLSKHHIDIYAAGLFKLNYKQH